MKADAIRGGDELGEIEKMKAHALPIEDRIGSCY
jgi:hypothetical protein